MTVDYGLHFSPRLKIYHVIQDCIEKEGMSDRVRFDGNNENQGKRGRGAQGGRGGSGKQGQRSQNSGEKPKKESILDLSKYMDKMVRIKFTGGREGSI